MTKQEKQVVIFKSIDGSVAVNVQFDEDTAWLSLDQMAELFDRDKSTISRHIKNIFKEGELVQDSVVANFATTALDGKTYQVDYYNLDVIISVGYRVKSLRGTQFRQWASGILKEYLKKGFAMDDDRLKGLGGGNYFKELLERIRDIRSSEKVMYRQVLDLYATAIDYDPKSEESLQFFKIIQNKLHYAAHGHTASEAIYFRVDSNKPFAGLSNFKGSQPTQAEAMIAKNYLSEQELKVLNNLVSAYFDFAELNAIEEREMKMKDYVIGLDRILSGAGRKLLENAGEISHQQAQEKAKIEYKKYKAKTLSDVEKDYLDVIQDLNQQVKKVSRRK
ncbi:putative DNA-binding protein [Actinobacillus pleuropneumoniae]|uniref:virulence RhuM family protein n=1 Tax=Actinobacillus pleuropneumoniae TaxID=715 RepID=UPI000584CA3A|nr:virulence RhuM family protein [Actinobacillus pleuropneumoniae]KIE92709.1 putative DNA-binding protein [Actinobacillus pleuropneumoniae]KIE93256.1 putative DNA-binding protein [Actinobacillus pleuropneumoniae]KIE93502.1 putative DNA-binding protein [Actinobacillus pleuropneumoniae]KIE98273.1 putative DNA-binding protein [Actinobacillus pleuropneumoniae]KIE99606.1 putative DNA-binding protein [Actinobacillus pleuropneumoniae]